MNFTIAQYERTYENWRTMLKNEQDRIVNSSEARKKLMKGIGSEPTDELLKIAVSCIADLTGDEILRKKVNEI